MNSVFATKTENGFTLYSTFKKAEQGLESEIKELFSNGNEIWALGKWETTYELLDYCLRKVDEKWVAFAKWKTTNTLNGHPVLNKDEHHKTIKERAEQEWQEVGWIKEKEIL